jgi:hypothetical protein
MRHYVLANGFSLLRARQAMLVVVTALALIGLPATEATALDSTATVQFGRPDTGSPFPPPSGHDQSSNAKDNMVPRTVVISQGGSVTFEIAGLHQPAIYEAGTTPSDITPTTDPTPPPGRVNDSNGRLVLGPLNAPPATTNWTSPAGTFDQPGRYLVICNILPHFANFNMYGWVIVK